MNQLHLRSVQKSLEVHISSVDMADHLISLLSCSQSFTSNFAMPPKLMHTRNVRLFVSGAEESGMIFQT